MELSELVVRRPSRYVAQIVDFLPDIESARAQGWTWDEIRESVAPRLGWQGSGPVLNARLRGAVRGARQAVAKGRLKPAQMTPPGGGAIARLPEREPKCPAGGLNLQKI